MRHNFRSHLSCHAAKQLRKGPPMLRPLQTSKYHNSGVSHLYLRRRLLGTFVLLAFLALASLGLLPSRGKMQESVSLHTEQAIKGVSSGSARQTSEHTNLPVVATPAKFFRVPLGLYHLLGRLVVLVPKHLRPAFPGIQFH